MEANSTLHENMKGLNAKHLLLIIVFFGIISVNIYNINEECAKANEESKRRSLEKDFSEKLKTTRITSSAATTTTSEQKISPICQALINVSKNKKI